MTRNVGARILEARERCRRMHDQARGEFVAFVWLTENQAEQTHHGTTDYALAAWCDWRAAHPGPIRRARGTLAYMVPDLRERRTITVPATMLEAYDGTSLALTGCTWGYGGEGPHGTALVLADAGFFADQDAAMDFVGGLPSHHVWELDHTTARTIAKGKP